MTVLDWIIVVGCWLLIPSVLVLKLCLDRQALRADRELNASILRHFAELQKPSPPETP